MKTVEELLAALNELAGRLAAVNAQLEKARREIVGFDLEARIEVEPLRGAVAIAADIKAST